MVPSGLLTKQVGDKTYVLVGLKPLDGPKDATPGAPYWLLFGGTAPVIEEVPADMRLASGVNLPL